MIKGILIYLAGCLTGIVFMSLFIASKRGDEKTE